MTRLPRVGLSPRVWRLAAGAWAVAIAVAGVLPTQAAVHEASGGRDIEFTTAGHFVAYAVLGVLLAAALPGRNGRSRRDRRGGGDGRRPLLALALAAALGGAIELVQVPLPYRDGQVVDVVVNVAGAAAGLALFGVALRARRSRSGLG